MNNKNFMEYKKSNNKKLKKVGKIAFISFLISFIFLLYFENILYPAYINSKSNCGLLSEEEEKDWITLGETSTYENETGGRVTNVSYNKLFEEQNRTIPNFVKKHEKCHFVQIERYYEKGYFYPNCEKFYSMYLWELECWNVQYLPDWIYIPLYGEYD